MNRTRKYFIASLLLTITINIAAQKVYNVKDYGAVGDGKTDDAAAIQKAIDACSAAGGWQVLFPASHTFIASPFNLKSNIDFHVQDAAKLLANPDEKVYTKSAFRDNPGEGTIWIGGENIHNLTISGTGEIDGNGI
jgi:polygalacturonase